MRAAFLFAGLALLLPTLAHAEDAPPEGRPMAKPIGGTSPSFLEGPPKRFESPQRFALEIKLTPYSPKIDQSAGLRPGETPFADLFNSQLEPKGTQPSYGVLTSVEFDWQFLRRAYGNFGIGITTGFYRRTTHSFQLDFDPASGAYSRCQPDLATMQFCTRSGDETALNIVPLTALFVYRFDLLANRYHVPLVPYIKIGLAYYIWWINDGGGFSSIAQNPESAYGGTFGWVVHPGLALQLDFIERSVAKTMDHETGINHTYLFCELNYADIRGFGAANKMNLSDLMVNAGFAIEF